MNSSHPKQGQGADRPAPRATTVDALLQEALGLGLPAAEARLLLMHAAGLSRERILAFGERAVSTPAAQRFRALAEARARGEPIAYLTGTREFYGRDFAVAPGVLIPRPETELLVEFALAHAPAGARVLDLGAGSGAIAVSLAAERPDLKVSAGERSAAALAIAQANNRALAGSRVRLVQSDWYAAFAGERFEIIVANPPYIPPGDPHLAQGDLRFEPADALTDHADGLRALRTIVAGAPAHLAAGGWIAVEHGYDQAKAVRALLAAAGFEAVESRRDLAGIERIGVGHLPA